MTGETKTKKKNRDVVIAKCDDAFMQKLEAHRDRLHEQRGGFVSLSGAARELILLGLEIVND